MKHYFGSNSKGFGTSVIVRDGDHAYELPQAIESKYRYSWGFSLQGSASLAAALLKSATGCHCGHLRYADTVVSFEIIWQLNDKQISSAAIQIRKGNKHTKDCELKKAGT